MSGIESCPICGGPSFEGEPCRPQCDPGALKKKGIDLLPLTEASGQGGENAGEDWPIRTKR